jgi:hypothetical protein
MSPRWSLRRPATSGSSPSSPSRGKRSPRVAVFRRSILIIEYVLTHRTQARATTPAAPWEVLKPSTLRQRAGAAVPTSSSRRKWPRGSLRIPRRGTSRCSWPCSNSIRCSSRWSNRRNSSSRLHKLGSPNSPRPLTIASRSRIATRAKGPHPRVSGRRRSRSTCGCRPSPSRRGRRTSSTST